MKTEDQRIAIAEACGWTFQPMTGPLDFPWVSPTKKWEDRQANPPNYTSDLNAMHEAEKILKPSENGKGSKEWSDYVCNLCVITGGDSAIHSSAAQRAEAFLKTLGKWREA